MCLCLHFFLGNVDGAIVGSRHKDFFFCGIYSICSTVDLVVSENFKNWGKTVILSILAGVSTIQPSVGKQFQKSV